MREAAGRRSILVVDDEAMLRLLASEMLNESGFRVEEAATADDAVAMLRERADEFCFVFSDVNLPGTIDGIGLAETVSDCWPWIDVLLTSGQTDLIGAELPGRTVFTPKPWQGSTLMKAVAASCPPH